MKKDKPILFNGDMVRAILAGTKKQTRRLVKLPFDEFCGKDRVELSFCKIADGSGVFRVWETEYPEEGSTEIKPQYQVGDRLWVRETYYCDHYAANDYEATRSPYIGKKPTDSECVAEWLGEDNQHMYYRADVESGKFQDAGYFSEPGSYWKPSIHMPRWASRITLKVTGVRVERLQDISEEDAKAEGIYKNEWGYDWKEKSGKDLVLGAAKFAFANLWIFINGSESWKSNPWVWVYDFEVVK